MAKIVIIGGGFGGLNFLHKAKKSDNEFILIDKTNHHLFQPLLYQVATAVLSPADIAVPIRHLFNNDKNVNVILGEVKDIDKDSNLLTLDDGEIISYDYLILSVGSKHSYFGKNDWSKYSNGLKIINDALDIRDRILKAFEKAEKEKDELKRQEYLNFVIVGAGPTGVEMAGSIAEIAFKNMKKEYRNFDTSDANVYLIEAGPKILSMFSEKLATKAEQYLKDLGVTVRKNEKVINIKKNILTTESSEIATDNIIWAAGNEASPLIKKLDTDTDLQGRALVDEYCLIKDSNNIFVIGDASNFKNKNNKSLPGIAPVAIQQGRYLAKIIKSNIKNKEMKPFKYTDKGMMATVGKFKAVGVVGNLEITGLIAWLFWSLIHLVYLIGYRSKIVVAIEWIYAYFFNKRGTRLIYRDIDR
ncbi:MAG: NAD(P)/FAD-dependent oxidoreductase [Candidatus Actinomarina sp.]|nr:NAD(P)/FAD-dependent oxidoreductase [Candidatus Actinomarina sp.]